MMSINSTSIMHHACSECTDFGFLSYMHPARSPEVACAVAGGSLSGSGFRDALLRRSMSPEAQPMRNRGTAWDKRLPASPDQPRGSPESISLAAAKTPAATLAWEMRMSGAGNVHAASPTSSRGSTGAWTGGRLASVNMGGSSGGRVPTAVEQGGARRELATPRPPRYSR